MEIHTKLKDTPLKHPEDEFWQFLYPELNPCSQQQKVRFMTSSRDEGERNMTQRQREEHRSRVTGKHVAIEELKVGDPGASGVLPQVSPHQEEIHQSY